MPRTIPRLECLEDRSLLSVLSPGVKVLSIARPAELSPGQMPYGFAPSQIRRAYGFDQITFANGAIAGDGRGQTIAVVDAYDQPDLASDLAVFDSTFGIAAPPSFARVNEYGGSALPPPSASWGVEESLDVEWAHAIAPGANIVLVEASSPTVTDLLNAVNFARNLPGVAAVSMSFGGGEFSSEAYYDGYFTTLAGHSGVAFVASSGDSGAAGAPEWPSVSPDVLAIGGTQLTTDASGNYLSESGWSGSGGGISLYESQSSYQSGVVTQTSNSRTVPDVAYDASTLSPFAIYDTAFYSGWIAVGGTSCGAPQWSALVAIVDQGRALAGRGALDGRSQLLPAIYALPSSDFHDVTSGSNGGYSAGRGYDLVTGRGSPIADAVVAALVGPTAPPAKPTLTTLAVTSNPSVYGTRVTFTAEVLAPGGGVPTGGVEFLDDGTPLGEGTLTSGVAAFSVANLPTGGDAITAVYEGCAAYASSSSVPLVEIVRAAPTITELTPGSNRAAAGQTLSLTAVVASSAAGASAPTGTVWFLADAIPVGGAILNSGSTTLDLFGLTAGQHRTVAVYSGDGNDYASESGEITVTINPGAVTALAASAPPGSVRSNGVQAPSVDPRHTSPGSRSTDAGVPATALGYLATEDLWAFVQARPRARFDSSSPAGVGLPSVTSSDSATVEPSGSEDGSSAAVCPDPRPAATTAAVADWLSAEDAMDNPLAPAGPGLAIA
jgi:hypothetical protein